LPGSGGIANDRTINYSKYFFEVFTIRDGLIFALVGQLSLVIRGTIFIGFAMSH
jgi:hypothetical protein